MTRYIQSFPASNNINDKSVFNIYRAVVNHLFNFIPESLFKTKVLDFKDNVKNIYTYKDGSLVNRKEAGRLELPSFTIEFVNNGNNPQDHQINTIAPFTKYSIAEGINPEMRGYIPLYQDQYGMQIFCSPIQCKTEFNITMAVQSLDDRNSLANILDNNLRQHYGYEIDKILTQYLLPHGMIDFIRESLYYRELLIIRDNRDQLDNDEIKRMSLNIDNDLVKHMETMSDGVFTNVRLSYNDEDLNLAYNKYNTRAYYKMNGPITLNEGERRGELYDKYTISTSGYVEFYNIIAFIVNVPSVIKGEWIHNYHILSYKPDASGKLKVKSYPPVYIDQRNMQFKNAKLDKGDLLCYEDREFLCDNGNDEYPISLKMLEALNKNYDEGIGYYFFTNYPHDTCDCKNIKEYLASVQLEYKLKNSIMELALLVYSHLTEEYFKKSFKIFVWKDNEMMIENQDYKLNSDLSLSLFNTNSQSVYSFQLYCNEPFLEFRYQRYLEDLEN